MSCLGVGAVVVSGFLWWSNEVAQHSTIDGACGGVSSNSRISQILGSENLAVDEDYDAEFYPKSGVYAACAIEVPGEYRQIEFEIGNASVADDALAKIRHNNLSFGGAMSVPIRGGWPGVVTIEKDDIAHATVVINCSAKKNDSLVVNVTARVIDDLSVDYFQDNKKITELARTATDTAAKVAEEFGCNGKLGDAVPAIPATPQRPGEAIEEATGTCKGVRDIGLPPLGVRIEGVLEAPSSDRAPIEECLLGSATGGSVYRLVSFHGAFAEAFRSTSNLRSVDGESGHAVDVGGWAWATAKCGAGEGESLYVLANMSAGPHEFASLGIDFERKVLSSFVQESAKRRECEAVKLP